MNRLRYVLALPSIESLEATNVDNGNAMHFYAPMPFMSSNIRSLSFSRSPFTNHAMFELLEATKQLQSFSLYGTMMNMYMLKAFLLATAKDTLESLRLRSIEIDEFQGVEQYLGTLRSFQALHTLEVDQNMLVKPWEGPCLSHLDAILPSSLRSLTIWCQGHPSFDEFEQEFHRLLNADIGRAILPNLRQIVLCGLGQREMRRDLSHVLELAIRFEAQGTYY